MIKFEKFHGAGNDFIIVDDRSLHFPSSDHHLIERLCNRHFGIGADGLMLLQESENHAFKMVYFNSDGNHGSMCGNGGRCIVRFAESLGLIQNEVTFEASDGVHHAELLSNGNVALQMIDVSNWEILENGAVLLNTGSPHFVLKCKDINGIDVVSEGRRIRNSDAFRAHGVNVNFVEMVDGRIKIRTYERGVEDETLACGTGVTAAAIAANIWGWANSPVLLSAVGGELSVNFNVANNTYSNIWKTGPVAHVFSGAF